MEKREKKRWTKETWLFVVALAVQVVGIAFVVLWHGVINKGSWSPSPQINDNLWYKPTDFVALIYATLTCLVVLFIITLGIKFFSKNKVRYQTWVLTTVVALVVVIIYILIYIVPNNIAG